MNIDNTFIFTMFMMLLIAVGVVLSLILAIKNEKYMDMLPTEQETQEKLDAALERSELREADIQIQLRTIDVAHDSELRLRREDKITQVNIIADLKIIVAKQDEKITDLIMERDLLMRRLTISNSIPQPLETDTNLVTIKYDPDMKVCSICKKHFLEKDQILACPRCMTPGHKAHIEEWVKVKGSCPTCTMKL